jgi:glutamate/tyrosine decarboxylase-like PLP-dependent enzyme
MNPAPTHMRTTSALTAGVHLWRQLLARAPFLSQRFLDRYAIVLARMEQHATAHAVQRARSIAVEDPQRAVTVLAGVDHLSPRRHAAGGPDERVGGGRLRDVVRAVLAGRTDVTQLVMEHPPLERTTVPLHPARHARLLRHGDATLVALRWPAKGVLTRREHQERMGTVVAQASMDGPLRFAMHEEYVIVEVDDGDPWVFAPDLGATLEDVLRSSALCRAERAAVVSSLAALRRRMIEHGVVWQGFAPRNMFLRGTQIVLIDFEEVVDTTSEPARAAECLVWHRVFFADCLDGDETATLFPAVPAEPRVDDGSPLTADAFERALLGVTTVRWAQRRELLYRSVALEGRYTRPSVDRDGGVLYGHQLGHFWGDFVPVGDEARLFRHLSAATDTTVLVACLEVFEAAMEADICRMLRNAALGNASPSTPRTTAVVDLMEAAGVDGLAELRAGADDWYEQLVTDPAGLVDGVLHSGGATAGAHDAAGLGTYLVGADVDRKAHEESLSRAISIGLDFTHRPHNDEPYLHYRDPAQLIGSLGQALPQHGIDLDTVLAEVDDVVARFAVSQSHPGYLAFPDSANAISAITGMIVSRLLNQNLIAVDRSAPSATFVEIQVIEWLRELAGYNAAPLAQLRGVKDVAGLWTTGGHLSNHVAMLAALGTAFPEARGAGLRSLNTQPVVVLAGAIAHYSYSDAAFHLGLGRDAVITVGSREAFTTDPNAVEVVLANPPAGRTPFMVVGVAGNCRTTGLDDLTALAEVSQRHGVWFHTDACHGGSLIFNERLRRRHLVGIERADSISLDPHKGLFTPYPSSYVIFRERGVLTQFSRHEAAVMADDCWDLGLITPFLGSRGFDSLATWMLLKHFGTARLGAIVEGRLAHVRYLERRIDETGLFVRLNDVDFYRLAFVFCPPQAVLLIHAMRPEQRPSAAMVISRYTSQLNTQLYRSGQVCFDEHTLADLADRVGTGRGTGLTIMAACPGNPLLTRDDLDTAVDRLEAAARTLVAPMLADLSGDATPMAAGPPRVAGPAGWSDEP